MSQAGTLAETVQLVYEPVPADSTGHVGLHLRPLRAFDLKSFDSRAENFSPRLLRPWVLEVDVPSSLESTVEPSRLLIARQEDGRWQPLVTNYHSDRNILVARILSPGRFAVLHDSLVDLS